mmetsp:Transcript_4413/g.11119  ORF Transcript_4413/g.11119 Transcript_4413/m.11119 type:complete len:188 (+) Transcript_4413:69-632(+)
MIRCCKAFLPILKAQASTYGYRGGRIFNIASMAGVMKSAPGISAYTASKHAAVALSSSLRQELEPWGIQVCSVCPSFHRTALVEGMHDNAHQHWKSMPKQLQDEYGEECTRQILTMLDKAYQFSWKSEVVVDEFVRGLRGRHLDAEMIIGTDSRLCYLLVNMLPTWLYHTVQYLNAPHAVPRSMRKK